MTRMDGTAAAKAFAEGLYVPGPGRTIADRIVAKAELGIKSAQAVVGGIGSGKTTELIAASERLKQVEDTHGFYCESLVQEQSDLIGTGLLILSFGALLQQGLLKDARFTYQAYLELDKITQKNSVMDSQEHLRKVVNIIPHPILLFDSLDRIMNTDNLADLMEHDMRSFIDAGFSVVMVVPLRMMYGPQRALLDRFDEVYHQSPVDIDQGPEARDFLFKVLRARAAAEILPDDACMRLVAYSGGVLRDLISLARSAGEHAYLTSTGPIEVTHIDAAADGFGRKKLINLSPHQIGLLQKVRTKGSFVQVNDQELTLNLPDHTNQDRGIRSHLHPGNDDLLVPAPLCSPEELLDLFIHHVQLTRPAPRVP